MAHGHHQKTAQLRMDPQGFRDGARQIIPLVVPVVPFGIVLGVAINESGIGQLIGWSSSWIVFAGSAQFVAVELLGEGTGVLLAALTIWIINARHVMYSAAVAGRFADAPRWWKLAASYVLIDQNFALLESLGKGTEVDRAELGDADFDGADFDGADFDGAAFDDAAFDDAAFDDAAVNDKQASTSYRMGYLFGAGAMAWLLWQIWVLLGVLLGDIVPNSWSLIFAIPILFLMLMVLAIKALPDHSIPALAAASVGGAVSVFGQNMPNGTGLLLGAILGIIAGAVTETVITAKSGAGAEAADGTLAER